MLNKTRAICRMPETARYEPTQVELQKCYKRRLALAASGSMRRRPPRLQTPIAALVGDHDPAHAQRLAFPTLELPDSGIFVSDCARELCRRHRYGWCE